VWRGKGGLAWRAMLLTLAGVLLLVGPVTALATEYHVFGTDKVGQDVLFLTLKSIRTALVIGTLTTLVTLPLAVALGIVAGYLGGWVDDVIQYVYTVLNSIPGVLLIAAAVLMMQVVIDTHPSGSRPLPSGPTRACWPCA
jgi:peptide/nickel transport system permease protein